MPVGSQPRSRFCSHFANCFAPWIHSGRQAIARTLADWLQFPTEISTLKLHLVCITSCGSFGFNSRLKWLREEEQVGCDCELTTALSRVRTLFGCAPADKASVQSLCGGMANMAAVSCTSLPVHSTVAASPASSHHVECSAAPQLGAASSRRRACASSALRAGRLSCASSLGGSLLGPELRHSTRRRVCGVVSTRCESSSEEGAPEKIPFGYTRKDVILIGVGITVFGYGLKYGLEAFGVDSLRAGNVVQITMVAGLTIGWIASYVLRVSNKDMTYAKQLKDYENKVMEKRLEELPEAELESMLAQVEEEKIRLQQRREKRNSS